MSLLTNWGYTITNMNELPDLMSFGEYEAYAGRNSSSDDTRVSAEISAACAAIRNYVGWHLGPSAACRAEMLAMDRRVTRTGCDLLIQLPARYVTGVSSVAIGDHTLTDYDFETNGILRVFDVVFESRKSKIIVDYTAGISDSMMAPIKELVSHRVTHAIAVPPGITSEASGGVSVTYNANWINNSRATALAGDNKELLIPYRVQGVF